MRFFWKVVLKLLGWQTNLTFPYHHLRKYIVIIGPHTSSWDFIIGVAYRSVLHMEKARFLGKKELFKPPFGFIFRLLGGTPVDRQHSHNLVDEVVNLFNTHDDFAIALSPEGTRARVEKLKTGFYFIAKKANVPIIMVGIDYENKKVVFSEPLLTSDNQEDDFEIILTFFRPMKGKFPEKGLGHL
jgi:1-acyl-sn-glycerol-3-phosphate acyltransferase